MQLELNRSREAVVPQDAIEEMLGKMTVPELHEARKVDGFANNYSISYNFI